MPIKAENIKLLCTYGSEELSVDIDVDGEVVFAVEDGDTRHSVYVKPSEAKMFADTIMKVIAGRV